MLAEALAVAAVIASGHARAHSLTGLAPFLPACLLARALAAAVGIASDDDRAESLTALAPHLPEADRPGVLAQALDAATAVTGARARAVVGLAPFLPAGLLAQALAAAVGIASNEDRVRALTGLAPHLSEADRPGVLAQALETATAITYDYVRVRALTALAPHLSAELLNHALRTAPIREETLIVFLRRAWALHERGTRLSYVVSLRHCLTGVDRGPASVSWRRQHQPSPQLVGKRLSGRPHRRFLILADGGHD